MPGRGLLIIDDEEGVRRSLAFLLGDEGFEVDTAVDADEALERCEARSYDVILCDVRMPRRDGLDLHRVPEQSVDEDGYGLRCFVPARDEERPETATPGVAEVHPAPRPLGRVVNLTHPHRLHPL